MSAAEMMLHKELDSNNALSGYENPPIEIPLTENPPFSYSGMITPLVKSWGTLKIHPLLDFNLKTE